MTMEKNNDINKVQTMKATGCQNEREINALPHAAAYRRIPRHPDRVFNFLEKKDALSDDFIPFGVLLQRFHGGEDVAYEAQRVTH